MVFEYASGNKKIYDRSLDINYGYYAELAVIESLKKSPLIEKVISYPRGIFNVDLIAYFTDGNYIYIDVERRYNWNEHSNKFPFDTVNIPYRKKDMIINNTPFAYFIVRSDIKKVAILNGDDILDSDIVENKNKYVRTGELFMSIPSDKIIRYVDL